MRIMREDFMLRKSKKKDIARNHHAVATTTDWEFKLRVEDMPPFQIS